MSASLNLLRRSALLALPFSLVVPCAWAARPMITDDARVVDAKSCQVESWVRNNPDSREYWALPACNFTGNLELTLGGAQTSDPDGHRMSDRVFQGKTLFRPLETNSWAIGLAFGNVGHPDMSRKRIGDLYSYVPASFSFLDDKFVLHTNVGVAHARDTRKYHMTWGVGSETRLNEHNYLIAETFGQNEGRAFYQVGLRHWVVLNHVQLDTTYGNRAGSSSDERWFSIGLRLLSSPFLP